MNMNRRRTLLATLTLLAFATPLRLFAQAKGGQPSEGTEFRRVSPPQAVETGDKIEVLEFFWYGCPHCYSFMPSLEAWRAKLPADVEYRRLPVAFDNSRAAHTKIYYALEQLKRLDLHEKVFRAIHVNKKNL
ncbi:MAG TPA: thiol:disulfide interchange protein DsbA/DsbL, partial [Burkholderiaceae bacterium]|nr:thiol:disulfide interchange protein DsbA/DsbL [Burkholderiaceae bacterium]